VGHTFGNKGRKGGSGPVKKRAPLRPQAEALSRCHNAPNEFLIWHLPLGMVVRRLWQRDSKETKQRVLYARWPLAASANMTNHGLAIPDSTEKKNKNIMQRSRAPGFVLNLRALVISSGSPSPPLRRHRKAGTFLLYGISRLCLPLTGGDSDLLLKIFRS
jgi:hypothetical protein